MGSCKNKKIVIDDLKWDNEHALYVVINHNFINQVLDDIDNAFPDLSYKKIYVVEKNFDSSNSLKLLFILNDNDTIESFRSKIENDEKIDYVFGSYDLPFDTIDTRVIECEKTNIKIGEETIIRITGTKNFYIQQFSYEGFDVKPQSLVKKEYKLSDFSNIPLEKIEKFENGWLYFELEINDYFSLIKSIDKVARLSDIEKIKVDKSNITIAPPISCSIQDDTIAEVIIKDDVFIVKGLSQGKTIFKYDDIKIEITVE